MTADNRSTKPIMPPMVMVEGGSFMMGDEFGDLDEWGSPVHQVTFTYDFWIGKYPVTFDEYDAFCDDTARKRAGDAGWGRGTRPVILVSWWDAIAYCNWLSERKGLPVAYRLLGDPDEGQLLDEDGNVPEDVTKVKGYRLPTEAAWEYAARGGNKSQGYKYAGSDTVGDVAWYRDNSGRRTQEVGRKAPNELGLYDMTGNVWEWCSDWDAADTSSAKTNPYSAAPVSYKVERSEIWDGPNLDRVIRGGSWLSNATRVRVARHSFRSPSGTYLRIGFRIARTVQ